MGRSGQNTRTSATPRRADSGEPVALIDEGAAASLLARAVKARMGALLAADANHSSADLRATEAGVYVNVLADLTGRQTSAVSLEVEKRALARIRAVEEGRDLDQAELEAAGKPKQPAEDSLDWRQAEVLRTLVRRYNERAANRGIMPGLRVEELIYTLEGTVPKTVVRKALRVLYDQGFASQNGSTWLWSPTALGADAVGETLRKSWFYGQFKETKTLETWVAGMLDDAAESRHYAARERAQGDFEDATEYDARAGAWLEAAVIASGAAPAELEPRILAHVAELEERDRERQEKADARQLQNTVVDAADQLHPRELEVLRTIAADHNRTIRSWNATMEDAGHEQIAGRQIRDLRVQACMKTDELVHALEGKVPKSAIKKALTRLHEVGMISYRFDGGMGGYWLINQRAFDALGAERAEFDEY